MTLIPDGIIFSLIPGQGIFFVLRHNIGYKKYKLFIKFYCKISESMI